MEGQGNLLRGLMDDKPQTYLVYKLLKMKSTLKLVAQKWLVSSLGFIFIEINLEKKVFCFVFSRRMEGRIVLHSLAKVYHREIALLAPAGLFSQRKRREKRLPPHHGRDCQCWRICSRILVEAQTLHYWNSPYRQCSRNKGNLSCRSKN